MFALKENNFVRRNFCKYEDEYHNSLFVKRNKNGFTAKIKFANDKVKANPITVSLNDKNAEGAYLHLDYEKGVDINTADISDGIKGMSEIIQRWIDMLRDIEFANCDNGLLLKANEGATIEDIWRGKMSRLAEYEEIKPLLIESFSPVEKRERLAVEVDRK